MTDTHGPRLEMLWEAGPAPDALHQRFGFADAESAGRWVVDTVREHWRPHGLSCERIVISDHNALAWLDSDAGPLLAKWSVVPERFPRLAQLAHLIAWLDGQDVPVSRPLEALGGQLQVELGGASIGVQRVIEGHLLDVGDAGQVRAAGAMLAQLHLALAAYPDAGRVVSEQSEPEPFAVRIGRWLDKAGGHLPRTARETLRELTGAAPSAPLPCQLVHGDFRSSNVLCRGSTIAAVIDFEEARVDHCIDEVARSAVLLGTRFHDWGPVTAEVRSAFLAGYESIRPLTREESQWWDVLVLWYSLAFVPAGEDPTGWWPAALSHLAALPGS